MCGGGLLFLVILVVLIGAMIGIGLLLLKLGVIFHYATKEEPRGESTEYTLEQSRKVE